MTNSSNRPSSLSEAIEKLERAGHAKAEEVKGLLDKDYQELRKAVEDLKPYLKDLKQTAEAEGAKAKKQVEDKVKDSPWMVLGVVGLVAFVIGLLLSKRRDD